MPRRSSRQNAAAAPEPAAEKNTRRSLRAKKPEEAAEEAEEVPPSPAKSDASRSSGGRNVSPSPAPKRYMRYVPPDHMKQVTFSGDVLVSKEDLESDDAQLYLTRIPRGLELEQVKWEAPKFDDGSIICRSTPDDKTKKRLEIRKSPFSQQQARGSLVLVAGEDGHLHAVKKTCGLATVTESIASEPYVLPPKRPKKGVDLPEDLEQRHVPFGASQPVMSSPKKKKNEKKKEK